nr:hypothetical protein [Klebsiella pneumoniae]
MNAVMAIADYLGVKNQIEVIEYSAESVQVGGEILKQNSLFIVITLLQIPL